MTRINLVDPKELHQKHLVAEYREIARVFALSRKAQFDVMRGKKPLPTEYTLGTGHVLFFYNKLGYILNRYKALTTEMINRGYSPNPIPEEDLIFKIDKKMFGDYIPTKYAIEINRARIRDRMPKG